MHQLHTVAVFLLATLTSTTILADEPAPAPPLPAPPPASSPEPQVPHSSSLENDYLNRRSDETHPATQEDLESLKDVLEEKIIRGVGSRYLVNFSGWLMAGFNYIQGQSNLFRVPSANLTFSGYLREDPVDDGDLRYLVSLFYLGPTSGTTAGNSSSVQVSDGVLLWDLIKRKTVLEPTFTLGFTLGQQLVPLGSDNTAREDKLPTINRAQYVAGLKLGRDVGLTIDGGLFHQYDPASGLTTPIIGYSLGAYNGSGANKWDDNRGKDFVFKLLFAPESRYFSIFRGLKFGGSYYWGNAFEDQAANKLRKRRVGGEFEWLRKPFLLTGEYIRAWDESVDQASKKHNTVVSQGFVGTLFFTDSALPEFQPLVRFDYFDPDIKHAGNSRQILTVGFNYFFYQVEPVTRRTYDIKKTVRVVKLQVNWNHVWEWPHVKNDQYLAQLVANF